MHCSEVIDVYIINASLINKTFSKHKWSETPFAHAHTQTQRQQDRIVVKRNVIMLLSRSCLDNY